MTRSDYMCKCKDCICREGETRGICTNDKSENFYTIVKDNDGCEHGITEMSQEEFEKYLEE